MSADPTEAFLVSLAQANLLDAAQLADVRSWVDEFHPDPQTLAKELTRRGLLTSYQVKEIYKGRARDLTIGSYQLLDVLGEGGMGRVFKAKHMRLGREVALKVIRKEKLSNPVAVGRFRQEIHAAAQLSHPNVVMAFDAEEANDGGLCLSMEFVEGTDLTKLVRANGPMPIPMACDAIRQAATGLQHAFERGLVHRDVKPSNLLLTPRGQVKVLDLGLALLQETTYAGGENANRVTQEGFVLGTPDFLAPEQAQNPTGVDIRADVYALGATLFYLVSGRVPYEGANPTEKMLKHVTEPPPSLLSVLPTAPPQLDQLIAWIMAKRPEDRPQTPAQVAMALLPFCPPQAGSYTGAPAVGPASNPLRPTGLPKPLSHPVLPAQPAAMNTVPGQPPAIRAAVPVRPVAMPQAVPAMPQAVPAMPAPYPYPAAMPQAVPAMPAPYPYPAAIPAPQPAWPNPFADMKAEEDEEEEERPRKKKGRRDEDDEPKRNRKSEDEIRVRKPKTRSNLPLIIFGGVAMVVMLVVVVSVLYWGVSRQVSAAKPLEPKFDNAYGMTMAKIEPGEFTMGSPEAEEGRGDDEGPAGKVKLTQTFYMSTTEITQGTYLELMGSTPSINVKKVNQKISNRMPVDNVSYENALEFCRRLTGKENGRRPGWGYRLPTEAEWEYCARAGSREPFAFGRTIQLYKHGIFLEIKDDPYWETNPEGKIRETKNAYPVQGKEGEDKGYEDVRRTPNNFGLYDMHGNLWEWCSDFYSEKYPDGDRTDPSGPDSAAGGVRVVRGGAWNEGATLARSASRKFLDPKSSNNATGFRVVFAELKK